MELSKLEKQIFKVMTGLDYSDDNPIILIPHIEYAKTLGGF